MHWYSLKWVTAQTTCQPDAGMHNMATCAAAPAIRITCMDLPRYLAQAKAPKAYTEQTLFSAGDAQCHMRTVQTVVMLTCRHNLDEHQSLHNKSTYKEE